MDQVFSPRSRGARRRMKPQRQPPTLSRKPASKSQHREIDGKMLKRIPRQQRHPVIGLNAARVKIMREATRELFSTYEVATAQQILGDKIWAEIVIKDGPGNSGTVFFEAEGASYIVSHAPSNDDLINVYLTRLPA
jgi:hypothetical protein